ncbi:MULTISPECIES: hypothetical protein [Actinoplanes]|uniref:hypothetical protein n=1 Tax=Actinoplanes TaxID=1865 RepID=UPI0005F2ED55|nr:MULTISPECIES: hypothetical protein [Actinoplanes]GLY05718.1 hypothetical protein Acsp01_60970 [Actinoplanes sp. NBRC 101535]
MTNLDLELWRSARDRADQLSPDAQRIMSVACVQRMERLLIRSVSQNELRRPVPVVTSEGLSVAWAICAGDAVDPGDVVARLRAFGPVDADDEILTGDSSILAFVQDLPDLIERPALFVSSVFNVVTKYRRWTRRGAVNGSAALFETAALFRDVERLEDEAITPELVDRIRDDAIRVGEHLVTVIDDWHRPRLQG